MQYERDGMDSWLYMNSSSIKKAWNKKKIKILNHEKIEKQM